MVNKPTTTPYWVVLAVATSLLLTANVSSAFVNPHKQQRRTTSSTSTTRTTGLIAMPCFVKSRHYHGRHHHDDRRRNNNNNNNNKMIAAPPLALRASSASTLNDDNDNDDDKADSSSYAPSDKSQRRIVDPSWKDILEIPIPVATQEEFDAIPLAKRLAIISRVSVLHLTFLSCFGPFILRGALGQVPLTLGRAALFTLDGLSWHVVHNMLNDWQDLDDDDADVEDSFRLAYGCHALKQGFMTKSQFLKVMTLLAAPGLVLTVLFANTVLAPAAVFGIVALFFYTILFKPLAMGEIVIYLVWGPLMAGFGQLAAGAPWQGIAPFFCNPAVAQFGLAGFGVIMGKHTDKITRSQKKTLPKVLGIHRALQACKLTLIAPHALLLWTFWRERVMGGGGGGSVAPTVPLGAALAFLTLFREFPAAMRTMNLGPVGKDRPNLPRNTIIKGTILDADVDRAWPLWFVAFMGWHAVTFAYLMVIGSGAEWIGKALWSRFVV